MRGFVSLSALTKSILTFESNGLQLSILALYRYYGTQSAAILFVRKYFLNLSTSVTLKKSAYVYCFSFSWVSSSTNLAVFWIKSGGGFDKERACTDLTYGLLSNSL